jgi:chaperonin GroEL
VEEGILPGGGVALLRATAALDQVQPQETDEKTGVEIIRRAADAPIKQISANSGIDGAVVVEKVRDSKDPHFGFNAATLQYGDMMSIGVIDPTKVVRTGAEAMNEDF